MNKCKECGKPAQTLIQGKRVQGTVAGTRHGKGSYYCQVCIDKATAEQESYRLKSLKVSEARFVAAAERINRTGK